MSLSFSSGVAKDNVFASIDNELILHNLTAINKEKRPWGGFFVIDEKQAPSFLLTYFSSLNYQEIIAGNKLSPKILIVEGGKRLSWQYHYRRAEIWTVIGGTVGIVRSENDKENPIETFKTGDIIKLRQGERHRLVGLTDWGIIAEIWQHTNKEQPSDDMT